MDNPGNQNAGKQPATIRYVDQPECHETFADSINNVFFDGQTMRIEFGITRMDELKQGQPMTGRRYPACRLVLPVSAAIELINRMQQTANALQQAGLLKPAGAAGAEGKAAELKPAELKAADPKPAAPAKSSLLDKLSALDKSSVLDRSMAAKPSIFDKPASEK
ncbi:MAG: hypothetical protein ACO1NY_10395 [Pseudorhodoplanes sp.]